MTGYEKVTLDSFKSRLENGDYASIAGARRGIGKMAGWNDKDREKARALAEKYFGVDGGAPKKAAKKAAKRGKKAKAKTAPARAVKKAAKKGGRRRVAESAPSQAHTAGSAAGAHAEAVDLANHEIRTVREALDAAALAHQLGGDPVSSSTVAKRAQDALGSIVDRLCVLTQAYVASVTEPDPKATKAFEKAVAAAQAQGSVLTGQEDEGANGLQTSPLPLPAQPTMVGEQA